MTSPALPPVEIPDYEVARELGRGGMGVVYLARQRSLERDVALKVIPIGRVSRTHLGRFLREVELCVAISHPRVVKIIDAGTTDQWAWLAMEAVDGPTLERYVFENGPLRPHVLLVAMEELADALDVVHSHGIVHRDIKTSNVMVVRGGGLKLMDFGLARGGESEPLTHDGTIVGSPRTLAPETVIAGTMDTLSDLYSLGIVYHEMATATRLFLAPTLKECLERVVKSPVPRPSEHEPSIPPSIDAIVLRLTDKDPARRYADARALLLAIREVRGAREFAGTSWETSRVEIELSSSSTIQRDPSLAPRPDAGSAAPVDSRGPPPVSPQALVRKMTVTRRIGARPPVAEPAGRRPAMAIGIAAVAGLAVLAALAPRHSARPRAPLTATGPGAQTSSGAGGVPEASSRATALVRLHAQVSRVDLREVVGAIERELGDARSVFGGSRGQERNERLRQARVRAIRLLGRWPFHSTFMEAIGPGPATVSALADPTLPFDAKLAAYEALVALSHVDEFLDHFAGIGRVYRAADWMAPWIRPLDTAGRSDADLRAACHGKDDSACLSVHVNPPGRALYLFAGLDPVHEEMTYVTLTPVPTGYKKQEDRPCPRVTLPGPHGGVRLLALTKYVYPLRFIRLDLAPAGPGDSPPGRWPRPLVIRPILPYAHPEDPRILGLEVSSDLVPPGSYQVRIRSFRLRGVDESGCRVMALVAHPVSARSP